MGCLEGVLLSLSSSWSECGVFSVGCGLLLSGGGFVFVCELLSSSLVGDGILATLSAVGLIVGTCDGVVVLMYVISASSFVLMLWLFLLLFSFGVVLFCGGGLYSGIVVVSSMSDSSDESVFWRGWLDCFGCCIFAWTRFLRCFGVKGFLCFRAIRGV